MPRQPSLANRCLWTLALAVPVGVALGMTLRERRMPDEASASLELQKLAGLFVSPAALDFGEVWEQSDFKLVIPIENTGVTSVSLSGFRSSCLCTSIEPKTLSIPPGETRRLTIQLDLTAVHEKDLHRPTRSFSVKLTPFVTSANREFLGSSWVIGGHVKRAVHYSLRALDLGSYIEHQQPLDVHRLWIDCHAPTSKLDVTCTSPYFRPKLTQVSAEPRTYELALAPAQKLPVGTLKFTLRISAHLDDGQVLACRDLPVSGEVKSDLQVQPPHLHLGPRNIGDECYEHVQICSITERTFKVLSCRSDAPQSLTVQRVEGASKAGDRFQITQRIVHPGNWVSRILFTIESDDGETTEVPLVVQYHGI